MVSERDWPTQKAFVFTIPTNLVLLSTVPSTMFNPMSTIILYFSTSSSDVLISTSVSCAPHHHSSAFWLWSGVVSLLTKFIFGTSSTQMPHSGLHISISRSGKANHKSVFSWNLAKTSQPSRAQPRVRSIIFETPFPLCSAFFLTLASHSALANSSPNTLASLLIFMLASPALVADFIVCCFYILFSPQSSCFLPSFSVKLSLMWPLSLKQPFPHLPHCFIFISTSGL